MTTRTRDRIAGAAVMLGAVVLASACNDSEPAPTPSETTTTSSPSPSTSTTSTTPPLTPADEDLRSAKGTIARYWAVLDELAADPKKSLELVTTVARDQAAAQSRSTLGTYQAKGWTLTGQTSVTAPTATTKDGKTFAVSACVDVSNVNIVDKNGKSVVRTGRPDQQRYAYTVVKAPQGFFVTVDTLKGQPC